MSSRANKRRSPHKKTRADRLWHWGAPQIGAIVVSAIAGLVVLIVWARIGPWFDTSAPQPVTPAGSSALSSAPSSSSSAPQPTVAPQCTKLTVVGTDIPADRASAPIQVRTGGRCAPVYAAPSQTSRLIARLRDRTRIHILCTVRGQSVNSFLNTSSVWDRVIVSGRRGYINDGTVWTGSRSAVARHC